MHIRLRLAFFILIPAVLLPLVLVHNGDKPLRCLYMLIIMASFWFMDILPYGVTSILPVMFAPLLGIEMSSLVAKQYSSDSLMLCLGRLIMACAFQQQKVHRRFGLFLLSKFGPHPRWIILACMIPSYILTMFISNTATAPIMLEFAIEILEIIKQIEKGNEFNVNFEQPTHHYGSTDRTPIISQNLSGSAKSNPNWEHEYSSMVSVIQENTSQTRHPLPTIDENEPTPISQKLSTPLFLSTGYAASCGAVATIVACGPNLVLYGFTQQRYHNKSGLNYGSFIAVGLPLSIIALFFTWFWIGCLYLGPKEFLKHRKNTEKEEQFKTQILTMKSELGPISFSEISCIGLTGFVIILWITRELGANGGWGQAFVHDGHMYVSDATSMILVIALFYIWPSKPKFWRTETEQAGSERLLSWEFTHQNLPWSIIFLLGAGFALADICRQSHLSDVVSTVLKDGLMHSNEIGIIFLASALSCLSTEFLSSTSALPIFLGIFSDLACKLKVNPFLFLFPLTFSASFAFCLPAATTPNIAIWNRKLASTPQMIKAGLFMDLVYIVIVSVITLALVPHVFPMSNATINCTMT